MDERATFLETLLSFKSMWSWDDLVWVGTGVATYIAVRYWATNRSERKRTTWKDVFGLLLGILLWVYLQIQVVHPKLAGALVPSYIIMVISVGLTAAAFIWFVKDEKWRLVMSGLLGGLVAFGALLAFASGHVPVSLAISMGAALGAVGGLFVRTTRFANMGSSADPVEDEDQQDDSEAEEKKKKRKKGNYRV